MTTVQVVFTNGLGQLTANIIRNKAIISAGIVKVSGPISLSDVKIGDMISIKGIATGNAEVTISVKTDPATPMNYPSGPIVDSFTIL